MGEESLSTRGDRRVATAELVISLRKILISYNNEMKHKLIDYLSEWYLKYLDNERLISPYKTKHIIEFIAGKLEENYEKLRDRELISYSFNNYIEDKFKNGTISPEEFMNRIAPPGDFEWIQDRLRRRTLNETIEIEEYITECLSETRQGRLEYYREVLD